ncbi:lipopolysaccharide biosynthesis protein [Sphingomonas flavalba]|uniref:lipopolysaccharide biosynthesis protein n=1 Tax=Sphingomonas flavalba TaxID=2559804 RepID=UPI00109DE3AD|nr:lipopolysaccharide biosynthesis protein [Sphingomonas flavalba]
MTSGGDLGIGDDSLENRVRSAVFWRSGSQILSQMVMWAATLIVIRLLDPTDYGLFAMTQVVMALFNVLNGYSFAAALIQAPDLDRQRIRQVFGMLILLNGALALAQLAVAPAAAAYYRQPQVADLLRAQALLYLLTPFIALPSALLSRALDFRRQARVNFAAAFVGATTSLACAIGGAGVWTLIAAPIALFGTRAVGLTIAAGPLVPPSFRFAGAGRTFGYGGALLLSQLFWIVQTQADVLIAGRVLDPHTLGLYAEALFLSLIFTGKFVPPLNEVAFPAYAHIQHDRAATARGFAKAARFVMLIACPLHLGLAATAPSLIETLFGTKWLDMAPLVTIIALAMPFMTLQVLFAPATNGLGRPAIAMRCAAAGAIVMPACFVIGIRWGAWGLAGAWLAGAPALLALTAQLSLPAIGLRARTLLAAVAPAAGGSIGMAAVVLIAGAALPPTLSAPARLALLVIGGAAAYGALLFIFARSVLEEAVRTLRRRR